MDLGIISYNFGVVEIFHRVIEWQRSHAVYGPSVNILRLNKTMMCPFHLTQGNRCPHCPLSRRRDTVKYPSVSLFSIHLLYYTKLQQTHT